MTDLIEKYQKARELTLAPGSLLELETVERDGIPLLAYKNAPGSMRDIWLLAAGNGDNDYLVYADERWTYAEAARDIAAFAAWLVEQGIGPGDRIAISMRNYPEWMLAHWAINSIGAVVVGMNAWWVADEMAYALNDSKPKMLIADDRRLATFAEIQGDFPDIKVISVREDNSPVAATPWAATVAADADMPMLEIDPDSEACIFYTSGTTGRPKGAQLTHRSCVANIMNVAAMGRIYATTQAMVRGVDVTEAVSPPVPAALIATPLFHVTANNCVLQAGSLAGAKYVLMYKWDPVEALKLIEQEKLTTLSAVPMMTRELLAHPDFADYDTSSLTAMGGGGAAMQPDLTGKVASQTKRAKPTQGYGMTEVSGIITYIAGDIFLARPESCGPLVPTLEGRTIDADGKPLPAGEIGEICVRGTPVIKGYLNRPEATAETIVDGWLHTGDIGYFDDYGFIFLVDRAKDMILRGGENVYGAEVENAIFDHPAVLECVAFAVPDERLGEEVGAAVHLKDGAMLDAAGLREHLSTKLAAFKIPRYLWFLAEPLPRNANGKFLKRELREVLDPASAD
ncbi:MAG: class I adenylate-forming enzyme family protein [Halieaceae bacterium]|jgi:acyl-CoA synthetase (AMP-forming)/AMP-acid ligase II|nr:class I adenylate-forming enzyme family protein [Halieaceae bacterium]